MFQYVEHKHDESNAAYPQAGSKTSHHFCTYLFNIYCLSAAAKKGTTNHKQKTAADVRAECIYAQNVPPHNILINLPI
jgi:hypothetical protein